MGLNLEPDARDGLRSTLARQLYRLRYGRDAAITDGIWGCRDDYDGPARVRARTARFNSIWSSACARYTVYRDLKAAYRLPPRLGSIEELTTFPAVTKDRLRAYHAVTFAEARTTTKITTGGSTGAPCSFPCDIRTRRRSFRNLRVGRAAHGIEPGDATILVWGHSHLFAGGLRGQAARVRRRIDDCASNIDRLCAYDLDDEKLDAILAALGRRRYAVGIAYSSVLRAIVRRAIARDTLGAARGWPPVWIVTSEQVHDTDFDLYREVSGGGRLVVEYGMAEFGPVAYSLPGRRELQPFGESFFDHVDANGQLLLTDIEDTLFPFISYATGDRVERGPGSTWARVSGRENDNITLWNRDGRAFVVHSEIFTHIAMHLPIAAVNAFEEQQRVRINLKPTGSIGGLANNFTSRLRLQFPDVDLTRIEVGFDYQRYTTVAGKEMFVVRKAGVS